MRHAQWSALDFCACKVGKRVLQHCQGLKTIMFYLEGGPRDEGCDKRKDSFAKEQDKAHVNHSCNSPGDQSSGPFCSLLVLKSCSSPISNSARQRGLVHNGILVARAELGEIAKTTFSTPLNEIKLVCSVNDPTLTTDWTAWDADGRYSVGNRRTCPYWPSIQCVEQDSKSELQTWNTHPGRYQGPLDLQAEFMAVGDHGHNNLCLTTICWMVSDVDGSKRGSAKEQSGGG